MLDCDVCKVEKIHQLVHSKTANHKVMHLFQLVVTNQIALMIPEVFGGSKKASKISDQHAKWTKTYLLKSKSDAVSAFQSFV